MHEVFQHIYFHSCIQYYQDRHIKNGVSSLFHTHTCGNYEEAHFVTLANVMMGVKTFWKLASI